MKDQESFHWALRATISDSHEFSFSFVRTKLKPGQALRGRLGLRKAEALGIPTGSVARPIRKIPIAPCPCQALANPNRDARFKSPMRAYDLTNQLCCYRNKEPSV